MNAHDDQHYWDLDEQAERGELRPEPDNPVLHGDAAVAEGQRILMWATETDTIEEALAMARRGHPRLSPGQGRSPVVRARLEEADYEALEALAERSGKSQSELVRQGVKLVLASA
ncbi:MAG: ribbon-helix-helix protein, CopG family [Propionibacteriaceae bacterium]|jgi:hypothetical protein|nr:ribbon-helix-helix protein, CopG family [Propionibacteriaceae bacterium]